MFAGNSGWKLHIRFFRMNDEDHVLLSEKLEDQLKAVEWAHEQK